MIKKVIMIISKVIVATSYFLIAIAAGITVIPFVLGYKPVVVLSGSMEPLYPVGSMIYYKDADFEDINEGDVITFRLGGSVLATHRVIRKDEENKEFITKGDNNQTEDIQPIRYEAVAGEAGKIVIPYVGFVANQIKEVPIMIALGGMLIIFSILSQEKGEKVYAKNKETNL